MITLFKRLAILVALWLGLSAAGVVYLNTRNPEMVESDVRAVLEPTLGTLDDLWQSTLSIGSTEPQPLPPDDVMRSETQTTLAEVETLYDELVATREAIAAAHTDQWEKRWARDAVTLAQMAKEQAIEAIAQAQSHVERPLGEPPKDRDMLPEAVSERLARARHVAALQNDLVTAELRTARETLRSAKGATHQD